MQRSIRPRRRCSIRAWPSGRVFPTQRVFLSRGGDGVFAAQQGETHLEPICKAEMRNATGAGDAMMASLVWSFLAGRDLAESCAAGTAAAAIAVESEETINPNMSAEAVLARAAK